MRATFSMICVLFVMVSWAEAMGSREEPPRPAGEGKTSLQLIAEAREAGVIDQDTATLYRVYSVVDADRLPQEYAGTRPMKDGTAVLRQARARFETLRPEIREELRPYLFPRRP